MRILDTDNAHHALLDTGRTFAVEGSSGCGGLLLLGGMLCLALLGRRRRRGLLLLLPPLGGRKGGKGFSDHAWVLLVCGKAPEGYKFDTQAKLEKQARRHWKRTCRQ